MPGKKIFFLSLLFLSFFLIRPTKVSAYNKMPECKGFEQFVMIGDEKNKTELKTIHPDRVSTNEIISGDGKPPIGDFSVTTTLNAGAVDDGTALYVYLTKTNNDTFARGNFGKAPVESLNKPTTFYKNTNEETKTLTFQFPPITIPGVYNVELWWDTRGSKDIKFCDMGTVEVYDAKLAQVYCSLQVPNPAPAKQSFDISTNLTPKIDGVTYLLMVYDGKAKLPTGVFQDRGDGQELPAPIYQKDSLSSIPSDSYVYYTKGDLPPGEYIATIVARNTSSPNHYLVCTKQPFSVENGVGGDIKTDWSKNIRAPGAKGGEGLGPGNSVCTLPQTTFEQYQILNGIELFVQNSRFAGKGHVVVIQDSSGKTLPNLSSVVTSPTKDVKLTLPKDLPPGEYKAQAMGDGSAVCNPVPFTIKETEPAEINPETGKPNPECPVPTVGAQASVYLYAKGLDKDQEYFAYFNNSEFPITQKPNPDGTMRVLLSNSAGKDSYPYKLTYRPPDGQPEVEVCSGNSTVEQNAADKQAEKQAAEDAATFQRLKCGENLKDCPQSTGQKCDPGTGDPAPNGKGILTALGCIPTEPGTAVKAFMKFTAGASGGVALLMMVLGAFRIITSAGNPETVKKGQEQFQSAVIGLLFIIFSVLLLQIIGVDILQIPGFR